MDNYNCPMGADTSNAPWNQADPEMETCPLCEGHCYFYYDDDGECVEESEYIKFPDKYIKEVCEHCDGVGEVEVELYEPDPDYEYDSRRNGDYD